LTRVLTSDGTAHGAIAESGFTYDSTTKALVVYGDEFQSSDVATSLTTGTSVVTTIPTSSGSSANFDYCVTESGGAMRSGTVKVVWDSSTAGYTDISTTDIVDSTEPIEFTVDVSGGNVRLNAVITSGTWTVKVATKVVF